jgi:phosphoribosyl-AMP cyclohydrolase
MTLPDFIPDFAKGGGLIAAIAQDAASLEVLMLAWMNEEAWRRTLETGEVHYYSRSRNELWHKGATSGHVQRVVSIRPDCDGDAVLVLVDQHGAACHEGYRSCFFRELRDGRAVVRAQRLVDPDEAYGS